MFLLDAGAIPWKMNLARHKNSLVGSLPMEGRFGVSRGVRDWNAPPERRPAEPFLQPGAMLGKFRIERLIGYGGMGDVYVAKQPALARDVAVKVLSRRKWYASV